LYANHSYCLGEGAFGKVKLGTNIFTGEQVAVKIISGEQTRTKKDILQLEREVSTFSFPFLHL
jgi:serine/threonine protein kinase